MRYKLGSATSQLEIRLWRKAAAKCGMPIQIEIWESLKPRSMHAIISVHDPDLDPIWQKYQKELIKRYNHHISISDLMDHKIDDIQKEFQCLFDKTPQGKRIIAQRKKEDEIRSQEETKTWMAKPSTISMFSKAFIENANKSLLSTLMRLPSSDRDSFILPSQIKRGGLQ